MPVKLELDVGMSKMVLDKLLTRAHIDIDQLIIGDLASGLKLIRSGDDGPQVASVHFQFTGTPHENAHHNADGVAKAILRLLKEGPD